MIYISSTSRQKVRKKEHSHLNRKDLAKHYK